MKKKSKKIFRRKGIITNLSTKINKIKLKTNVNVRVYAACMGIKKKLEITPFRFLLYKF